MLIRPKSMATVVVRLALDAGDVVGADARVGEVLLGLQRQDLAARADQRGLADAEAAGDEDLERERDAAPTSERPESIDHRLQDALVGRVDRRVRVERGDQAGLQQIADEHPDHADRQVEAGGDLGDRQARSG